MYFLCQINKLKLKEVKLLDMSCPWVEHREEKATETTNKYGPLHWELQQRYCQVTRQNIIIDSQDLTNTHKQLVGDRYRSIVAQIYKSVLTSSLHIAQRIQ